MRIVFMGTPEFAVPSLEKLMASRHRLMTVYTQPDSPAGRGRELRQSPAKRLALAHGLTVVQPISLKWRGEVERLASFEPDAIVVAAYGLLLPQRVLDLPPLGCLNAHPSLLPRHRGPTPVPGAIMAGDEETGVTIMLLDAGMDTGPILSQRKAPIEPEDTTGSLSVRLAVIGADLLMETLEDWEDHLLIPSSQDDSKATYTKRLTKEEGEIDWNLPAVTLWRKVRAFQPWPGCYTRWQGKLIKLLEVTPLAGSGRAGEVVVLKEAPEVLADIHVGVMTSEGTLGVRRLQLEGRKPMSGEEFVRGQRGFVGAVLPS
ncbi:MAG: methionyl-tRNA formyltransferase [Chloroflexi bacterium]|nr:methionyl-tRNA formyltransferase [Chloroflexota bacterium]